MLHKNWQNVHEQSCSIWLLIRKLYLKSLQVFPELHYWICSLDNMENIGYHQNAKPMLVGDPIMGNGKAKGKAIDGRPAKEHINEAKQKFIEDALETLGILLDSPTAAGSAGNSGT